VRVRKKGRGEVGAEGLKLRRLSSCQ